MVSDFLHVQDHLLVHISHDWVVPVLCWAINSGYGLQANPLAGDNTQHTIRNKTSKGHQLLLVTILA